MYFTAARAPLAAWVGARLAALGLVLTALLLSGCGSDAATGLKCVPGRVVACACAGGGEGYQACSADGAFSPCSCFGGAGAGGSGGAGGASGAGGSGANFATPGETCQILGATAPCSCGGEPGRSSCYSYDTGPAWSACDCPEPLPTGGIGGSAGTGGAAGIGGTGGAAGVGGTGGAAGFGGTGGTGGSAGFAGTSGFGGTGGSGALHCPDGLTCIVGICADKTGNLPPCSMSGATCMGTGTCINNSGAGGVSLVCYVSCTP